MFYLISVPRHNNCVFVLFDVELEVLPLFVTFKIIKTTVYIYTVK